MNNKIVGRAIMKTGIAGAVIGALCCATPLLVILLGAVGLSAWAGWLDYVLLPAMLIFIALIFYGLYLKQKTGADECCTLPNAENKGGPNEQR